MLQCCMNTKLFIITFITFFAVDMVWLGLIAKNFYQKQIGFLMRPDVNWGAALLFYLLFIVGLIIFVIAPAVEAKSVGKALIYGALFGLISYSTYDLTNLATIKDWPILVTIVDLIWGTTLSAVVSSVSYLIYMKI